MRRLLFLIFIPLMMAQFVTGQSVYYMQQDASWEVRYSAYRKADHFTNLVVKQLALAHLKIPEKTSFTFFYNYGASVSFEQGSQLEVSLSLTPSVCTGDVSVRKYDLQQLLIPAICSFRLAVISPVKGEVFSSIHDDFSMAELLPGYALASFPDSLWTAGCRIEVEFRAFRFDEPSFKRIERELYAIRDYDAAATFSDTLEKRIRHSRVSKQTPEEAFRTYVFSNKGSYLLGEAAKTKTEIVPGNDPRQLLTKVPVVQFQFEDLTDFYINNGISGRLTGPAYHKLAISFSHALGDALSLSQSVDYYSSPFYYKLYSNSTTAAQLLNAKRALLKFQKSRGIKQFDFKLLSREIVREYILLGEKLMAEGRFAEAVDLLTSGQRFCSINPLIFIPDRLVAELANARSGLTASYIRIVQKALDNNLPSLADKYLSEAMLYAGRYGMSAADSAGFAGLYSLLTGKNLQSGKNLLSQHKYQEALTEFDKAVVIATQFRLVAVLKQAEAGQVEAANGIYSELFNKSAKALQEGSPEKSAGLLKDATGFAEAYPAFKPDPVSLDSLTKLIAFASFESLVNQAAELSKGHEFKKAVDLLIQATEISREYHIISTALYDSIVDRAVITRINSLLSESRLKLWAGEPENALMIAGEAMQLASVFNLSNSQDIKHQYVSVMELADESLCNSVKGEIISLINRADESYSQNKFEEASSLVLQARELIYKRAACGLNTIELNKLTAKYQHPAHWNETVKQAKSLIAEGDYVKGVEMIQQAGALFNYYRLDTLGLVNAGLYEIAMTSEHLPLIRHATGYYITRGGYDQAMQLLEKMRLSGVNPVETNDFQESLGRELARRDVAETDMLDLKTMLRVYTGGDKWYRRFSEVYRFHVENRE